MLNPENLHSPDSAPSCFSGFYSDENVLVVLDGDRRILHWSEKAGKVLGWEAGEVEGSELLSLLFRNASPGLARLVDRLFQARGGYPIAGRRAEVEVFRKDESKCLVELNVVPISIDHAQRFCVFIRDLGKVNWQDERSRLLSDITCILARADRLDAALPDILAAFCHRTPWVFGAFWRVDPEGKRIQCILSGKRTPQGLEEFVASTRSMSIEKGNSLPGRVWESEEIEWMTDLTRKELFIRAPEAETGGLKTGFAFPVKKAGQFFGVFEFFSREEVVPDADFLAMVNVLSGNLGEYIVRKQAEELIRISEERFRTASRYASFVPAEFDKDLRYRWIYNPHLDFDPDTVMGKRDDELEDSEGTRRLRDLKRRVVESGQGEIGEIAFQRSDGVRFYDFAVEPLRNAAGAVSGGMSAAFDITPRKRAERELEKFATLVEQSNDFIAIVEPGGRLIYLNLAARRLAGMEKQDSEAGRDVLEFIHPEDRELTQANLSLALSEGSWRGEFRLRSPESGRIVPVAGNLFPLRETDPTTDGEMQVIGLALMALDLTQVKEKEEQLHHAQKMEALGRLAGGVAHDFNNILTAIIGYSDLLISLMAREDPSRDLAKEIKMAGERAASLTRQLLAYSRKQVLQKKFLVLNDIVRSMETMLRRLIGENVILETSTDQGLWAAELDPAQMEQVILNLAVNARDAMPAGGRLLLETRNVELDEAAVRTMPPLEPGLYVALVVKDTGEGMSQEVLSSLFEPFFTTKKEGKGTGLGLSMVYGIVQQSGGGVQVESTLGKGSAFSIYFPALREAKAAEETAPTPSRAFSGGAETVLLVEDDTMVRDFLEKALARGGYTVRTASSGKDAFEMEPGLGSPLSLLITDIVMPGIGGIEVAEEFRRRHQGIRVLFISGYAPDNRVTEELSAGRVELLAKPFSAEVLLAKVGKLLGAMDLHS